MEFDFFLADKLKMTVEDLRSRMSNDEYLVWHSYWKKRAQEEELQAKMAKG